MTPLSLHRSAFLVLLCGVLTACGAEVATTAVTATKLQAEQAKQATAQAETPGRGHAAHGSRRLGCRQPIRAANKTQRSGSG